LAIVAETGSAERVGEFCETEVFRAACADNEVVLLVRARYGRMRLGRCVEFDLGYIDCYTDVLTRLDKRCSGRRMCQVRIPDAEFEATGPCLKELKTYLEVSYLCVPGLYKHTTGLI
jgi:Galactose binding lectin domain